MSGLRILIAGAGIGGLATALSLRETGFTDIVVIEQAEALKTVGAGIQLSANAVRLLQRIGIGDALEQHGVRPEGLAMRNWQTGERLLWTHLGRQAEERFGAPYYHMHRADLLAAMIEAWGLENIRLGSRIVDFEDNGDTVSVRLADGSRLEGDLLIGADGIHSTVRQQLFGADSPRHSGLTALRGLVPAEALAHLDMPKISGVWLGPGQSMVHYWVRGGALMNWIGIVPAEDDDREDWTATGTREAAMARFEGWHPDVLAMIERTEAPFKMTMFDRAAMTSWHRGRAVLLGDACHAMLPFHAQGACMAIEDGRAMARSLKLFPDDIPAAIRTYEGLRLERANWVQAFSRQAEVTFHLSDPEQVARRDAGLRRNQANYADDFPPGQIRLYGYDADTAEITAMRA